MSSIPAGATTGVYAPKKIYIIGARYLDDNNQPFNWVYDPVEDAWSTAKASSRDHLGHGMVIIDDILYVIGGNVNEQYVPIGYGSVSAPIEVPKQSMSSLYYLIAFLLVLIIGIFVAGLFFYFKRGKNDRS